MLCSFNIITINEQHTSELIRFCECAVWTTILFKQFRHLNQSIMINYLIWSINLGFGSETFEEWMWTCIICSHIHLPTHSLSNDNIYWIVSIHNVSLRMTPRIIEQTWNKLHRTSMMVYSWDNVRMKRVRGMLFKLLFDSRLSIGPPLDHPGLAGSKFERKAWLIQRKGGGLGERTSERSRGPVREEGEREREMG